MSRLKREGNPPTGQLASPVPQYKDTVLNDWAELQGEGGASYVKDRDALAKLEQVKSELELVKAELAAIKANQLSGDQKVQLSGNSAYHYVLNSSVEVAVGTLVNMDVVVPQGELWIVKSVSINIQPPTGASDGRHILLASIGNSHYLFRAQQPYNRSLRYDFGTVVTDSALTEFDSGVLPSSKDALASVFKGLVLDSSVTLRFSYYNQTNASQTHDKVVRILVERRIK